MELILLIELAILRRLLRPYRPCISCRHSAVVPAPYRPNVRLYESFYGSPETIASIARRRLYKVGVNDKYMIGIILSDGHLYPFLHCPPVSPAHHITFWHHCIRVKVSLRNNNEVIPITRVEETSFGFHEVFKTLHHTNIQRAEVI